jgi:uncharacterized protein involved in exopolysaccharide biosynthesis
MVKKVAQVARKLRRATLPKKAEKLSVALRGVSSAVNAVVAEATAMADVRGELLEHADAVDRQLRNVWRLNTSLASQIPSIQKELASIRDRLATLERKTGHIHA